jgi:type I restriction enzyme S subunit
MAGERKYVKFRSICAQSAFGPRFSSDEYAADGNVACLRTMDIDSNGRINFHAMPIAKLDLTRLKNHILRRDDIVITRTGAYLGKVAVFTEFRLPVLAGAFSIYFRLKLDIADPVFVRYFFNSADGQRAIHSIATGSAQPNLNIPNLHSLEVPLPPLAEQKAIAAVLGALDDKIELNRRMNATLEAMARALFQSWFVDFDPVRAKLDARQPVGMDPATAALFPEHFAHGEHDMLPVGWRHATIEEVCAINAWTLGKNDQLKTLEYVEISEVSRGNIANIATYVRGEEPSRARRRLRHGDTVLSTVRPDRGSYFLALNAPENRVASTGFAVLTPTKVPWSFLHAALTQPEVSDHLGQMADGGAYPAVRPEIIGAMQVALPNEPKILEAFHRTCAPLFEQAEANRTQSRTLATLRDTLLPNLLSGELSVAATDKEIFVSSKHIKRTMNP